MKSEKVIDKGVDFFAKRGSVIRVVDLEEVTSVLEQGVIEQTIDLGSFLIHRVKCRETGSEMIIVNGTGDQSALIKRR